MKKDKIIFSLIITEDDILEEMGYRDIDLSKLTDGKLDLMAKYIEDGFAEEWDYILTDAFENVFGEK